MTTIQSKKVGEKIRYYRKLRHQTLQSLADSISKSRATVSKYESGQIVVDIEVLSEIADTLDVPLYSFISTQDLTRKGSTTDDQNKIEARYYFYTISDRSPQTVLPSFLDVTRTDTETLITLHFNATSDTQKNASFVYTGSATITNNTFSFLCTNLDNKYDQMYFTSSHMSMNADGILIGFWIGFTFETESPVCMKAVLSKEPIKDNDKLLDMLTVTSDEVKYFKRRDRFLLIGEL